MLIGIGYNLMTKISPVDSAVAEAYRRADASFEIHFYSGFLFIILANIYYWQKGNIIFFFTTVFYAGITSWAYFWLLEELFIFKKQNGLWKGEFSLSYFGVIGTVFIYVVGLAINYAIISYLRNKKAKTA